MWVRIFSNTLFSIKNFCHEFQTCVHYNLLKISYYFIYIYYTYLLIVCLVKNNWSVLLWRYIVIRFLNILDIKCVLKTRVVNRVNLSIYKVIEKETATLKICQNLIFTQAVFNTYTSAPTHTRIHTYLCTYKKDTGEILKTSVRPSISFYLFLFF